MEFGAAQSGAGVAQGTIGLTRTAVKTGNYAAAAGDLVPVDTTSGAVTVTLPNAPADRTVVAVKLIIQGGTNAVTLACAGSDVFNKAGGATSGTLSQLNQAMLLEYATTGGIWTVLADDLPLSVLDSRFVAATSVVIARKTADEGPLASNTTLQNDDHLKLTLGANDVWTFRGLLIYDGGSAGDFQMAFTAPAGAVLNWTVVAARTTDAAVTSVGFSSSVQVGSGTAKSIGTFGSGVKTAAVISGVVRTTGTAGDLQLQWAQAVSDATGATVYTDSYLEGRKTS